MKGSKEKEEQYEQMKAMLDEIPGALVVYEFVPSGLKIIYASQGVERLSGYTPEEFKQVAQDCPEKMIHPADERKFRYAIDHAVEDMVNVEEFYRAVRKDGSMMWVWLCGHVIQRGERLFMEALLLDITNSTNMYQSILDEATAMITIIDASSHEIIYANKAALDVTGDTYIGSVCHEYIAHLKVPCDHCIMNDANVDFKARDVEYGDRIYHQLFKKIQWNGRDAVMEYSEDVTETLREKKELERRYEYEQAKRGYHDASILEIMTFNISKSKILDYQSEVFDVKELVCDTGMNFAAFTDDKEMIEKLKEFVDVNYITQAYRKGFHPIIEYRRNLPNGEKIWVRVQVRVVRQPDSDDMIAFIYTYDINQSKIMEQVIGQLVEKNYEVAFLVNTNTDRIYYTVGEVHGFSGDVKGQKFQQVLHDYLDQIVPEDELETVKNAFTKSVVEAYLENHKYYNGSMSANVDGEFARFRWNCFYFDEDKEYVLITMSDITEIFKDEQRQKQKLEEALNQAKAGAKAKTDFLAQMSHDMRTPMNGILGLASLMKQCTSVEEMAEDIEQIELSGRYLLNLINDTLDMNRIESGKLELHLVPANGKDIFNNIVGNAKIMAKEKGIKLHIHVKNMNEGKWEPVLADPSRVEQIFMNIISNAMKFTAPGGCVTVDVENIEITSKHIRRKCVISDTGIGMSKEFIERAFEPFSQEGRKHVNREAGTGLGLSIVKKLVELMDGSIEIQSEVGVGTRVEIYFNYQRCRATEIAQHKKAISFDKLDGKRILLCEDHPLNAQIVIRLLKKKGVEIIHVEDGELGVAQIKDHLPGYYDAILMDIRMPNVDGLEATRRIRNLSNGAGKTIPIIAMTANAFEQDMKESKEAGMNAHLAKPFEPEKLYEVLLEQL